MSRWKPDHAVRQVFSLVRFASADTVKVAFKPVIVQEQPASKVLLGQVLELVATHYGRRGLSAGVVGLTRDVAHLRVTRGDHVLVDATATRLRRSVTSAGCPRCGFPSTYTLSEVQSSNGGLGPVLSGCQECGWRSSAAGYELGRSA